MLPQTLLRASAHLEGDRIVPHYFTARDELWLRAVMDEYARYAGRKQSELHERLREPLATRTPRGKLGIAIAVLDAMSRVRPSAAVPPKEARAALFHAAAGGPRAEVVSSVAASLAVTAVELEAALFADLSSERRVGELPASLAPSQLALDANLAIVTSLVRRAAHVRIAVHGNARVLVGQARAAGLICLQSRLERAVDGVVLDISGPFALFRHSEIYGRALASLLVQLRSSEEFELTASCSLGSAGHLPSLVVRSADPIGSGRDALRPDRGVKPKFERDFPRAAGHWELIREPNAIAAGETLIFPDFEIVHRHDKNRRWSLELVGFWTPEYLHEKLQRWRASGSERFLLCVDQSRECTGSELIADPRIIRFKTRVDPRAVLAIIERGAPAFQ